MMAPVFSVLAEGEAVTTSCSDRCIVFGCNVGTALLPCCYVTSPVDVVVTFSVTGIAVAVTVAVAAVVLL